MIMLQCPNAFQTFSNTCQETVTQATGYDFENGQTFLVPFVSDTGEISRNLNITSVSSVTDKRFITERHDISSESGCADTGSAHGAHPDDTGRSLMHLGSRNKALIHHGKPASPDYSISIIVTLFVAPRTDLMEV
ncbi:hypothetical protein Bbelb_375450 [Branchiostoma belcheri]|nr:hypothetical protein Bbelb_375450 [Branchiostoma belcheri]